MKEQKKSTSKVIVRSALILLLLTLISGCFLGSTFARYVSKGEGDLSAGVAEWKITETNSGDNTAAVKLKNFSPNMAKFEIGKVRKREMNDVLLFSLKNDGGVQANVYLTLGKEGENNSPAVVAYGYDEGGSASNTPITFAAAADSTSQAVGDEYKPSAEDFADIITMTPDIRIGTELGNATTAYTNTDTDGGAYYVLTPGDILYVLVDVAWTTDLGDDSPDKISGYPDSMNIVEADLRDTWIGENVAAVGWEYSWVALQGSELPNGANSTQTPNNP